MSAPSSFRGYYTIYDFEIKEMFGDYQTFLRAGGAAVWERIKREK